MAGIDQVGQQQPAMASMFEMIKSAYAGIFDSVQEADAFALSFDFAADGLTIDGDLTVKPDSKTAKAIAGAKTGDASSLAKLPADAAFFVYMNIDAKAFESMEKLALKMMSSGGKPTPEFEAALAKQREQGRVESISAMTMAKGMKAFNVYNVSDPKARLAAGMTMMAAAKAGDSPFSIYKDVKITPEAETHGGFAFTRVEMTIDPDKLAKLTAGNPAQAAQMKAMYGGDKLTSWMGIDDKQMIHVTAQSWDQAKGILDAYLKGQGTLGDSPAFAATLAKMPKNVNALMLVSAQGLVHQIYAQLPGGGPKLEDLPKEPILIGVSLAATPGTGFEFRLFIPSAVGKVIPMAAPAPANP